MKRRLTMLRLLLRGVIERKYGLGTAWTFWRGADWGQPDD